MVVPDVIGTVPQWLAALGVGGVLIALIRRDVQVRKLRNDDTADQRDHMDVEMQALRENIASLRKELHECEEQCADKIKKLSEELLGEKRQRVAEQVSLINIFMDIADEPIRKKLIAALESIQTRNR